MTTTEAIREIVDLLDSAAIPFMLVGSIASTFHGPPRSTRDIDLVVEMDHTALERLLAGVDPARFYVPEDTARAETAARGQFNLVDLRTGWKFDLIVRKDRAFSRSEFARRVPVTLDGVAVHIATPEDTVLSKLEWAAAGESDRQLADAASVLAVIGDAIDDAYLDRWAPTLGVTELLDRARRSAG